MNEKEVAARSRNLFFLGGLFGGFGLGCGSGNCHVVLKKTGPPTTERPLVQGG